MIDIKILPVMMYKVLNETVDKKLKRASILMSSYDIDEEKFKGTKKICFKFDDIKVSNENSFNIKIAKQIHEFVDEVKDSYDELYVCCDSGESRSSAVAAATYRYFGKSDKEIWSNCHYHPNEFVYKIMCEEYGVRVSNFRLKYNMYINKNSLKKQIKKARKR